MALRRVGSGGSVVPLFHEGGGRAGVHELPFRPFRSTFRLTWVGLPSFTQSQEGGGGSSFGVPSFRCSAPKMDVQFDTAIYIYSIHSSRTCARICIYIYMYMYIHICVYIYAHTHVVSVHALRGLQPQGHSHDTTEQFCACVPRFLCGLRVWVPGVGLLAWECSFTVRVL